MGVPSVTSLQWPRKEEYSMSFLNRSWYFFSLINCFALIGDLKNRKSTFDFIDRPDACLPRGSVCIKRKSVYSLILLLLAPSLINKEKIPHIIFTFVLF